MSTYSPEQIGRAVRLMYTDLWSNRRDDLGLLARRQHDPSEVPELAEILPALQVQFRGGSAGQQRRRWVEFAAGDEHMPGLVPDECDVATHEPITYRFPEASELLEMAAQRSNQVLGLTVRQARRDNNLIRIFRHASRLIRDAERRQAPAVRRMATRGWELTPCGSCGLLIERGQVILWDRARQRRLHERCPGVAVAS